jgi:PncC family amidohydrolase
MYSTWVFHKHMQEEACLEKALVERLQKMKYTITTAESCTGGLVSATLVNVPGASCVLQEAYITYSNEAKERLLGVSKETLSQFGAVSEQTAHEMAEGAARVAHADVALSTTGIAGPDGGTEDKPVGLVYIACSVRGKTYVKECRFSGTRQENRTNTVQEVLRLALEVLVEQEPEADEK